MSRLNELYSKYNGQGFELIAVTGESTEKINKFVYGNEQFGVTVNYPIAASTSARQWGVRSIPQKYLIGPDGTVVWEGGPNESGLEAAIEKALSQGRRQWLQNLPEKLREPGRMYLSKNHGEALNRLEEIMQEEEGDLQKKARELREKLKKQYDDWMKYANNLRDQADYYGAIQEYEQIAQLYDGHKFAQNASSRVDRIHNEANQKYEASLNASRIYHEKIYPLIRGSNANHEQAKSLLNQLIQEFPDADFRKQAEEIKTRIG